MSNNKSSQLSNHTLLYGLVSVSQNLLSFLFLPILTEYLTMKDFGTYGILLMLSAISTAFFYLGASSALGRFFYEDSSIEFKSKIISMALFITISGSLCLLIIASIFSSEISNTLFQSYNYRNAIYLTLITSAFTILLNLMTLLARYNGDIKLFSIISILSLVLNFIITYISLKYFKLGILSPLFGTMISACFSFVALFLNYSDGLWP